MLKRLVPCGLLLACGLLPCAEAARTPEAQQALSHDISLNGTWEAGLNRNYNLTVTVPGIAQKPAEPTAGTLWYRRWVVLPTGDWNRAELTLHGARFAPVVYIDGKRVSSAAGGMAPTVHLLNSEDVRPGARVLLEIALCSLTSLDPLDASMVPAADRWRSDNSSGLWDSVSLHVSRGVSFTRVTPFTDWEKRLVRIHWTASGFVRNGRVRAVLLDEHGRKVAIAAASAQGEEGDIALALGESIANWSPAHPEVYKLRIVLAEPERTFDQREFSWGFRKFVTENKHFMLNGEPIELRGGTVVWHRFLRNPQAAQVAFDPEWFRMHVVEELKGYGANYLRFHLGLPPEELLDLCDREGLIVQLEWPFFHGVKASEASMREQWHAWIDVAMRHPSVMILHPWNETEGNELQTAWSAMNAVLADYPAMVVAQRDTLHIHKYWWSLFENLGLYYDSADQFDKAIMVDEFGGNYLNSDGGPGLYPAVKETFLRFLGREQTREERLDFQAEANARVAEYWRRIGAAGFAPFCILSSPEDGNSWFLGDLRHPQQMPVWDALSAAFSPQSASLDIWDRNFTPGERITVPLYFFNDTDQAADLTAKVTISPMQGAVSALSSQTILQQVPAHGRVRTTVAITMPAKAGEWKMEAVLQNHVEGVVHPVVSQWNVRTLAPRVPTALASAVVGVPAEETELRTMLAHEHIRTVAADDPQASLIATSARSWASLDKGTLRDTLRTAVARGQSVVMLDVGPTDLGQASKKGDLGPLDGAPRIAPGVGYVKSDDLFLGLAVRFYQVAEPESHIQPGPTDSDLWKDLPRQATWLWNGLRGGLIVPAAEMEITGLGPEGFLAEWGQRGADTQAIRGNGYYAYRLAAYYAFSSKPNDAATEKALRQKVTFLVEDAPALQAVVDPLAPIEQTNLTLEYQKHLGGKAAQLIPLSTCGKSLTRTDVAEVSFGARFGRVILSQVMTAGRLVPGEGSPGIDHLRYDPAAEQFVLNTLAKAIQPIQEISAARVSLK